MTEDILPFITYGFQVSFCNAIGCGRFTDTVIVMTAQDGKSFGQTILELVMYNIIFAAPDEAPDITESMSPTSTSLYISWNPPSAEKQNGILIDYVVCYTDNDELAVDMWQKTSTPTTNITLTNLSIFTEYTVSVAAATVAGVGPSDTVNEKTLNDSKFSIAHTFPLGLLFVIAKRLSYLCISFIACSEPFGVMFTDIGETTIALEWNKPAIPNGIVDGYVVRDQLMVP